MALRFDKYSIAGIVGVIFFISLGVYGLQEEKIEEKVQADYQELLKKAEKRFQHAENSVNILQSKCNEFFESNQEKEYEICIKDLSLLRMELTSAQVHLYDMKSELGLG